MEAVYFLLATCAGLIVLVMIDYAIRALRNQQKWWDEHYPPISDAEFLAMCAPGTNPEVALKVRRIVADNLGVSYERVHPSIRFTEDIGAD
jgi:hypothetical protein